MKTYKNWMTILAIGAAIAAPLYGCSSDDVETNKGKTNNAGGSGGSDEADSGAEDETDSGTEEDAGDEGDGDDNGGAGGGDNNGGSGGGGEPQGDEACIQQGGQACVMCCAELYPTGAQVFDSALISCLCTNPGVCQTECASLCGGGQPDQTCVNCANGNTAQQTCGQVVGQACSQSQDCLDFYQNCYQHCF